MVKITIDGNEMECSENLTILEAARLERIFIPTICYHDDLTPPGLCRQCVVEVEGARVLLPSCITKIREGMKIKTSSEKVLRVRKTILELLASSADLSDSPELQIQMDEYRADPQRFVEGTENRVPPLDDNPFYFRDYSKCILCAKCVQVCSEDVQFSYALTIAGRGYDSSIATFFDKELPETSCVFCGNCVEVCPTGALKVQKERE